MDKSALVVHSDESLRSLCAGILKDLGFEAHLADSASHALTTLENGRVDIVLTGVEVPGARGVELLRAVKQKSPETEVVIMADSGTIPEAVEAIKMGAYDYIANLGKPFKAEDLKHLLQRLAEKQQLARENRLLREELGTLEGFGNLIGASQAMQGVYRTILKVAAKRHPVLILGESGTGKELVALAIHAYSPWHSKPFVPIDCGALPPTLIESELFGHVRGAFTGADQARQGLLATAQGGTVFLDEIAELPVGLQVKLLRAFQEREFKALGSDRPTRLDARILAATNQDLEAAIQRGTFRKDLYYRLNVVAIKMPKLGERKEDIPALVHHFIDRHCGEGGVIGGISNEAMTRLMSYNWPGNVRELENCIQHALAMAAGPGIEVNDLPPHLISLPGGSDAVGPAADREVPSLEQLERRAILKALEETGGDRLRAAKLLGIGKTTIYRKLKEYGLDNGADVPPPA
jgi:DNA-binding NtrC family response regulator